MVPPTNAAWHSRNILPILRFGETSWDAGSTSETYGLEILPDRRSVGIESETTQTDIDWGAPRVPPCLREARRSRVGESDQFRPLPSRARLAGNDTLHANCRTKNLSSARQFQRRASPIGDGRTHLSITRRGPRRLECSYGCGQHDKRSCVAAFQLSRRQRQHNLPDQLRVHPRSDRNGIA
jgi:hypothetical protein